MPAKNCVLIDPELRTKLKAMNDIDLIYYTYYVHISLDSQELIYELASRLRQLPPYKPPKDND